MLNDTILVQRANVVLHIHPQQLDYYMNQGFNLINERGEVIQASVPRDLGTLQKAFVENSKEIESLKAEIEDLKKKLKKAKSQSKKADE